MPLPSNTLPATEQPGIRKIDTALRFAFGGKRVFPDSVLRSAIAPIDLNQSSNESIETINATLKKVYSAHGYLEAKISATRDSTGHRMDIEIDAGPQFHWGEVKVESDALPAATMKGLFPIESGYEVNMSEFASFVNNCIDHLKTNGYPDASYDVMQVRKGTTYDLTLRFKAGKKP